MFILLSTSLGPRLIFIFNFSKTSAEPHFEETDLFPCLAILTPKLDNNNAAVEIFKVFFPSPPVPQVSIVSSGTLTLLALFRKT